MQYFLSLLHRYRHHIIVVIVLVSITLTAVSWNTLGLVRERLLSVAWIGGMIALTELLFVGGVVLMALSAGENIFQFRRLRHLPRSLLALRGNVRFFAKKLITSPLFAIGFWMNFIGAAGTSLLIIYGLLIVMPLAGAGVIVIVLADLLATFGWRVPLEIARRKAIRARRLVVRRAKPEDIKVYRNLQTKRWHEENVASHKTLMGRYRVFPEGMLVAEQNGGIVGMVYAMRITDYDERRCPSWYNVTNNGSCDNHDPDGPIIFGVDLTTSPRVGAVAGEVLLIGIAQLAIEHNIKWCMLGGRMPDYHKHRDKMSPDEYLWARRPDGKFLDRQVRFYGSIPGLRVVKVLPDYFHDPESDDNGVLLRWRNPFHEWPLPKFWAWLFPKLFGIELAYQKLAKLLTSKS